MIETETLDRLFLELSQFTSARTGRELALEKATCLLNCMVKSGEQHSQESEKIVHHALNYEYPR